MNMVNRKPNCSCSICKKPLYRRPSQIQSGSVFCSSNCTGLSQQKTKICKICGNVYIGSKQTCSRACANKSRQGLTYTGRNASNNAYLGSQLKQQLAQSRGGVCEKCHENNYLILQVHHIVERYRGGSNDLSNLELLCPNCHATHHLGHGLYKFQKML